ncbi:MAG TPA: helix-turn-helix domain-containing protein [Candidatus Nanoarchaeia archaeon]|nr:helix-turn-helix domain-containing protein [Candidatus Nanoarchaeia archaeon]
MIIKQELVKKLRNYFSLNIYETKVWLALLSKGISSAGEIAEISGVPRSRTYDVLEGLEKQGFVIAKIGKPAKFIAVEPSQIIEKLKRNAENEAKERVGVLSGLKDTQEYTELEQLHKEGINPVKKEDLSGSIKGRLNIASHLKEMLENSSSEVIVCSNADYLLGNQRIFKQTFERLGSSGIKVLVGVHGTESDVSKINSLFSTKARQINVNGQFFISDRKEMVFILSDPHKEEGELAVWLNSEFLAESISYLFEKAMSKK